MKYQEHYSRDFPAVRDVHTRGRKAQKILRSLTVHLNRSDLHGLCCLDLGCSIGVISQALADQGAQVVGLDIDAAAMQVQGTYPALPAYVVGDAGATPFSTASFDILVCSQVYEHVPSLELLVKEMRRLIKPDGVCFFSGPNRWAIVEEHYHLPFLSWLPRRWADFYVRASRRGSEYYEHPRSSGELRRALAGFTIYDLTSKLLIGPQAYGLGAQAVRFQSLARRVPAWGWLILGRFVPNFNWLLVPVPTENERG